MRVAVLHGQVPEGASKDELDVLVQVEAVFKALSDMGHEPTRIPFSVDVRMAIEALKSIQPDLVFNLVESVDGQGRLIHIAPAFLDYLRLPYTGAKTEAMFLTSNKLVAKKLLQGSGIETPQWFSFQDTLQHDTLVNGRYMIKSVWEHASIGLGEESVISVTDPHQLDREIDHRQRHLGRQCFAEAFVEGREFNISILGGDSGPEVLPPAEILFEDYPEGKVKMVCYHAKWHEESFEYTHTPRTFDFPEEDEPLLRQLKSVATECWNIFGLRGYARVDFRVDQAGKPWVLEVNANPCISPDSVFIAAANLSGLSYSRVIERIIHDSGP
jgi:D-alanine-D-alanine ligase